MPIRAALYDALPILELLTLRTRVATRDQVLAFAQLYPMGKCEGESLLSILRKWGYLACQRLPIGCPVLIEPLVAWNGNEAPDFVALASRLTARVEVAPCRTTEIYWATKKAEPLTGGLSGQNRQPLQVQHDLGITAVFLRSLEQDSFPADFWLNEDIARRDFGWFCPSKRPDAIVVDDDDQPIQIIEIGGIYSAADLRRMHRFFSKERVRYELW